MAVKDADVASVMCAYPHVNFSYNCDSQPLLQQTLRERWGFDGYVYSDRRAQQSTLASLLAGVNVELDETPEWYQPEQIKALLDSGEITEELIDELLRERYIKMFEFGDFDDPHTEFLWDELDPLIERGGAHAQLAKEAAAKSLVLLRNDEGLLPLNADEIETVALIGAEWFAGEAALPPRSGNRAANITVVEPYQITPEEGLEQVLSDLGSDAEVIYNNGDVIADAVDVASNADVTILMVGDVARETWDKNSNWNEENPGGNVSGAGNEIPDLDLPSVEGTNQQMLIPQILAANPNTVVVMKTQGQVNMPSIDDIHTMVQAWYPGQEDGAVVAEALFGVTNFSGKLPITIGRTDQEAAYATQEQYPGQLEDTGVPGGIGRDPLCQDENEAPPCEESGPTPQRVVRYSENLAMGYRWYEATGTEPLFPFGFGLSYTTFEYSDLKVTPDVSSSGHRTLKVDFTITNTGDRAGAEIGQVYLTLPAEAQEPSRRLVEFARVELEPGASKRVSVVLDAGASNHPFSYFQPASDDLAQWADGDWVTPDGKFVVHVGRSSVDTPLEKTVKLTFPEVPGDGEGQEGSIPIEAEVPDLSDEPGSLTLTIGDGVVDLGTARRQVDRLRWDGDLPVVRVTDTRLRSQAGNGGWSVSGVASDFVSDNNTFSSSHLGWLPWTTAKRPGVSAGPRVDGVMRGGPGLAEPATLVSATGRGRRGTASAGAHLLMEVPLDTPAGDYEASLTLTLFPVD